MVLADDQQLLAWCSVVTRPYVAHPDVADVKAVNDGEAEGTRTLNDTTTHLRKDRQSFSQAGAVGSEL